MQTPMSSRLSKFPLSRLHLSPIIRITQLPTLHVQTCDRSTHQERGIHIMNERMWLNPHLCIMLYQIYRVVHLPSTLIVIVMLIIFECEILCCFGILMGIASGIWRYEVENIHTYTCEQWKKGELMQRVRMDGSSMGYEMSLSM